MLQCMGLTAYEGAQLPAPPAVTHRGHCLVHYEHAYAEQDQQYDRGIVLPRKDAPPADLAERPVRRGRRGAIAAAGVRPGGPLLLVLLRRCRRCCHWHDGGHPCRWRGAGGRAGCKSVAVWLGWSAGTDRGLGTAGSNALSENCANRGRLNCFKQPAPSTPRPAQHRTCVCE